MPTPIVDLQAEALVELLYGGVNGDIDSDDPENPTIQKAHAHPLDNERLTCGGLPALLVFRRAQREDRRTGTGPREHIVTWQVEYHLAPMATERAHEGAAMLAMVWEKCVALVCKGRHVDVQDNALILDVAGFIDVGDLGPVAYTLPTATQDIAPSFIGTMILRHRTPHDTSALQALLSLDAQYRLVGGTGDTALADAEQPLVREILTTA
jgi:hypothetical protein